MKKVLGLSLSALMVASLAGCGGKTDTPEVKEFVNRYTSDPSTMDYVNSMYQVDHEHNANFVDGLLENDSTGKFVPALAEAMPEHNEDFTEWTFKLRKGVNWVKSDGEVYGEVKAQDFVTGLRHAADFQSAVADSLLGGVVTGFAEYLRGTADWESVGIETPDDYTVVYKLDRSTPYFYTLATYNVLMPINQEFLESKGTGCKLGAPDKNACEFGAVKQDSILYNGAFILETLNPESLITYKANPNYWDKEHVYVSHVKLVYDNGEDPSSGINGFKDNVYVSASINPAQPNYEELLKEFEGKTYKTMVNSTNFGVLFNYNRKSYEYTNKTTDAEKENTRNALLNVNFRKAFRAATDRIAYNSISAAPDLAKDMLRNITSDPNLVSNSEGKTFGTLVNEAYTKLTGETIDLSDGQDPFFSPDAAKKFIEAAKAEGIKFPVVLDLPTLKGHQTLVNQSKSLKTSVEANTTIDGVAQIQINILELEYPDLAKACYEIPTAEAADYDINTFTGWGPDYPDPKTFMDLYSPSKGDHMLYFGISNVGTDTYDETDEAAIKTLKLDKYEEAYLAADNEIKDMDRRYELFAECDATLIAEATYMPMQMDARGVLVTKIVPFTKSYADTGISQYKYKFMQIQDEIVTTDQYNKAYEEWSAAREAWQSELAQSK